MVEITVEINLMSMDRRVKMIIRFRKLHIKTVKSNPLAQKIREKQEHTLHNCKSKNAYSLEFSEKI